MSLKQTIYLAFDVEVFNTEEIDKAEQTAIEKNGELYCWKTIGVSNWLEKGLSFSDVLGIVILPRDLPEQIDILDDEETDE